MLPSRGLRWTEIAIKNGRQRLQLPRQGARNFSINATTITSSFRTRNSPSLRLHSLQQHRNLSLFGLGSTPKSTPGAETDKLSSSDIQIGPNSTGLEDIRSVRADHGTSAAPDPAQTYEHHRPNDIEPKVIEDLQEKITLPHGSASGQVDSILAGETDISSISERMGYLKEVCGLDFGWGPSAVMEYLLESLHVHGGLSWTAAIISVAVILRVAMVMPLVEAQKQSTKMREMQPFLKPLREKYQALLKSGDNAQAMQVGAEMREINKAAGVSYKRAFLPLLIQLPFGFGAFRVLRNAGQLPVPAFVTEDWLWTTDLSFSDPYYITPLISAAAIYFQFTLSAGSNNTMFGPQMLALLSIAMPAASFIFMSFQAGAVQLYFMTTGVLACGTSVLLRQMWFRNYMGLGPLPTKLPTTTPTSGSGPSNTQTQAQAQQTKLPAGIQRIEIPVTNRSASVVVESESTTGQDRSVVDRTVDNLKGKWTNFRQSQIGDKEGGISKWITGDAQDKKDASIAKLNALRQREVERERQERNKQAQERRS